MRIVVLGAAGFIGTNLIMRLAQNSSNEIIAVDERFDYFDQCLYKPNVKIIEQKFAYDADFQDIMKKADIVYHLVSTNNPSSSNMNIGSDIADNVLITVRILDACILEKISNVVFISSGGTVYGDLVRNPITEYEATNPINTYGIQKLTIEKILYLYYRMHGIDYRVVRLANPYGPHQRPNGRLGVITTFVYKALNDEELIVYGDGEVVRDYIYIDDAVDGIVNIASFKSEEKVFNLGSGVGTSVNEIIGIIEKLMGIPLQVEYRQKRSVDVPVNILDVTRYKDTFSINEFLNIHDGINKTIEYFKGNHSEKNTTNYYKAIK